MSGKALAAGVMELGEGQMKVYPHASTMRKRVCLKTHSLALRACMSIPATRHKIPSTEPAASALPLTSHNFQPNWRRAKKKDAGMKPASRGSIVFGST